MDAFRFILENPHPNASNNKQRKRARLVTACDSCRVKKIKCQQPTPNGRCDACRIAKTPCLFGDRDRYQAERGVTCTWNPPVEEVPDIAPVTTTPSSRKRKLNSSPYPTPSSTRASSTEYSRSATPAADRQQHAGPSLLHVFPQTTDLIPPSYNQLSFFDSNRPRFPHPYYMRQLAALFFDNLGGLFPFLDRYDVLHRIEQQTCSAILSNCIAGLAVPYATSSHPDLATAPFYDMAKSLASYVVSVPSVEALHALICLTWVEYGSGRADEFWMYSRMAIAMCLDLGLGCETTIQVAATPEVRHRLRLTWWMVVCTADIAASWVTGRPVTLDLDQYDTKLPEATDDASLLFRNVADLYVLRGKLNRVLDAHVGTRGDSSLDWDLSKLQTNLENMSKALPPSMVFNEKNLVGMRDRRMGHMFVQMHILIQAVSALLHRPSLLSAYGLPIPTEGPRAEAARSRAKCLADTLLTVERVAPQTFCDPFMNLPILVACVTFIAESDAYPMSPHATMLARQWGDTLLATCKKSLVRLSATWGGTATFDNVLDRHAGLIADDAQYATSSSFTVHNSNNQQWLLLPNLLDDAASDSSGSLRSSSRELSPLLAPSTTTDSRPKYHLFNVGGSSSPVVHEVDDSGLELHTREPSFYASELVMPESMVPGEDTYDGISRYLDEQCGLGLLSLPVDSAEAHNLQLWREDSSVQADFNSPLQWANQYLTSTYAT